MKPLPLNGQSNTDKGKQMRNPELKDPIAPRSKADIAITRAALNKSRLDNKIGSAKKAVAKKAAPKPTDSRFTGKSSGMGSPAKPKGGAGSMSYTPGSAKNNKSTYTTGSGVSSKASTPKAAPAQKTKPRFGGFSMAADAITGKGAKKKAPLKYNPRTGEKL